MREGKETQQPDATLQLKKAHKLHKVTAQGDSSFFMWVGGFAPSHGLAAKGPLDVTKTLSENSR